VPDTNEETPLATAQQAKPRMPAPEPSLTPQEMLRRSVALRPILRQRQRSVENWAAFPKP
jgi:hypothetical protein